MKDKCSIILNGFTNIKINSLKIIVGRKNNEANL